MFKYFLAFILSFITNILYQSASEDKRFLIAFIGGAITMAIVDYINYN